MCAHYRFLYALLAVTVGAFAGAVALVGVSFYWFNPSGAADCSFNIFVISFTIVITVAVSLLSMHPQVCRCSSNCTTSICHSAGSHKAYAGCLTALPAHPHILYCYAVSSGKACRARKVLPMSVLKLRVFN